MEFAKSRRGMLLTAFAALSAALPVVPASAQLHYPKKPIKLVDGFAAGSGNDIFALLVGAKLGEILAQQVVVENRPGAGGRLSAEYVSNQPPDGYTLLVGASGAMAIGPAIYSDLKFDPLKTLTPLGMIANFPLIMVVGANNPAGNVKEFAAWMKAHPDQANYASSSPAFTITTELLKLDTGMPGTMIPCKSSNEMILSVIAGHTAMAVADGPPTVPQVKAGKVKALAVTGKERSPLLPDVPSMTEAGYPGVDVRLWSGVFAPAATPSVIAVMLEKALSEAVADPDVSAKLKNMAVNPGGANAAQFRAILASDIVKFGKVVKAAHLHFE